MLKQAARVELDDGNGFRRLQTSRTKKSEEVQTNAQSADATGEIPRAGPPVHSTEPNNSAIKSLVLFDCLRFGNGGRDQYAENRGRDQCAASPSST